ncbi:MAG: hypothetical protein ABI818_11265 [Acidobacteriota bacterium]
MLIATAPLILVATSLVFDRRARRRLLARLRDTWGRRVERVRDMHAIAGYHRSRPEESSDGGWLDGRTSDDFNLGAVFALTDRTKSTIGQQALYHRLHTAPLGAHLDAFESLAAASPAICRQPRAMRSGAHGRQPVLWKTTRAAGSGFAGDPLAK